MSADIKHTDALKNWLESLGQSAPDMVDSVLPQDKGADWREVVLASMFDPAASSKSRIAAPAANDESKPSPSPHKPKNR